MSQAERAAGVLWAAMPSIRADHLERWWGSDGTFAPKKHFFDLDDRGFPASCKWSCRPRDQELWETLANAYLVHTGRATVTEVLAKNGSPAWRAKRRFWTSILVGMKMTTAWWIDTDIHFRLWIATKAGVLVSRRYPDGTTVVEFNAQRFRKSAGSLCRKQGHGNAMET